MDKYFTQEDEKLKWETENKKTILSTVVFDVTSQHCKSAQGAQGDYIVCDARDWAMIIPDSGSTFLMVKQWRHGEKALSVEFPGGVIEKGEDPEKAALRELEEETGCIPGKITKLGTLNPNPALFSNHMHVFLAEDLHFTGKQSLDEDEYINCFEMDKDEVLQGMGTPAFSHALMTAVLCLYFKYKK